MQAITANTYLIIGCQGAHIVSIPMGNILSFDFILVFPCATLVTRMHSSRMRISRALTVSVGGGGCIPEGFFWGKEIEKKKKIGDTPLKISDPPEIFRHPPKISDPP